MSDAEQQRIREEAAQWCARMMRSDADLHRAGLDSWLQADDAHRNAYERIMRRYDRAGVLAWSSLRRSSRRPRAPRWLIASGLGIVGVSGGLAAAAVMIMSLSSAITAVFGTGNPHTGAEGARTAENAAYRVRARVGEIRSITLPDGSRVVLDTGAQIAVAFGTDERHLTLSHGRARFEVAHETRPFVVTAGNGEITARGTIFDVETGDRGRVQVTLLRGAIDVGVRNDANGAQVVKSLQVNQKATFNPAGFAAPVQPAPAAIAEWPSGILDVDAVPLSNLLEQANRYTAVPVIAATSDVGSLKVSGRFRIDQPDLLAHNLADLFGLAIDRDQPDRIVLARKTQHPPFGA